jgi:hypothetical protein
VGNIVAVRHQVAIAGRVNDAGTQKPLAGAVVRIVEMSPALKRVLAMKATQFGPQWKAMAERPDRARTAADGIFYFTDLPDGKYTVEASMTAFGKRYGAARGPATVSRDANGKLKLAFLELGLRPTAVQGKVTGSGHKAGLMMTEIRVNGSGERAFSDGQGEYVLNGIEPGKRILTAAAQNYQPASKPVTIEQPGDIVTVNFTLVRDSS